MASGDTLVVFTPLHNEPPSSNAATIDLRNQHAVLDFDAATDESARFGGFMPRNYGAATGVTVTLVWMASTATTNDVIWNVSFERHADDAFDLDSDGFAAVNAVTDTTANVSGEVSYPTITFTAGADMDSVVAGDSFRLNVTRDADNGSDNMAGDAELLRVEIKET